MKKLTIHCGISSIDARQSQHHHHQVQMAFLAKQHSSSRAKRRWYHIREHEYRILEAKSIPMTNLSSVDSSLMIHTALVGHILFGGSTIPSIKVIHAPLFHECMTEMVTIYPPSLMTWYDERYERHHHHLTQLMSLESGYGHDLYHQYRRLVAQCRYAYRWDQMPDDLSHRTNLVAEFHEQYGSEPWLLERRHESSIYPQLLDRLMTSTPLLEVHPVSLVYPYSSPKLRRQSDGLIRFARILADHSSLIKLLQWIVLIVVFGYFGGWWVVGTIFLGFVLTWANTVYHYSDNRTKAAYDLFCNQSARINTMTKLHYLHDHGDAKATDLLARAYEGIPISAYQMCTLDQCDVLWQTHNDMIRMLLRFEYDTGRRVIFSTDTGERCRQYYRVLGTWGKVDHTSGSKALCDQEITDARQRFWDGMTRRNRRKFLVGGIVGGGLSALSSGSE